MFGDKSLMGALVSNKVQRNTAVYNMHSRRSKQYISDSTLLEKQSVYIEWWSLSVPTTS